MTLLTALLLLTYHLDYWAIYRYSSEYVSGCYARLNTPYRWIMALVGGQIDWLLMLGSITCSAFLATLVRFRKHNLADPRILYLAIAPAVSVLTYMLLRLFVEFIA